VISFIIYFEAIDTPQSKLGRGSRRSFKECDDISQVKIISPEVRAISHILEIRSITHQVTRPAFLGIQPYQLVACVHKTVILGIARR